MGKPTYGVGDTLLLKQGMFRRDSNDRACSVVAVLPQAYGLAQYHVQFGNERFIRLITQDEIDIEGSLSSEPPADDTYVPDKSSWIKTGSIKTKK